MATAGYGALAETLARGLGLGQQLKQQELKNKQDQAAFDLQKQQAEDQAAYQQGQLALDRSKIDQQSRLFPVPKTLSDFYGLGPDVQVTLDQLGKLGSTFSSAQLGQGRSIDNAVKLQTMDDLVSKAKSEAQLADQKYQDELAKTGRVTQQTQIDKMVADATVQKLQAQRDEYAANAVQTTATTPGKQDVLAAQAGAYNALGNQRNAVADQTNARTPVLVKLDEAKAEAQNQLAREYAAGASLKDAQTQSEAIKQRNMAETQKLVDQQYLANIAKINASVDLTEEQKRALIQKEADDHQRAIAEIATEKARAGVETALQAYHVAQTGNVEADTDKLKQELPYQIQYLANQADAEARRAALTQAEIDNAKATGRKIDQGIVDDHNAAVANLDKIRAQINTEAQRAEVYRKQAGKLQAEISTENLLRPQKLDNLQRQGENLSQQHDLTQARTADVQAGTQTENALRPFKVEGAKNQAEAAGYDAEYAKARAAFENTKGAQDVAAAKGLTQKDAAQLLLDAYHKQYPYGPLMKGDPDITTFIQANGPAILGGAQSAISGGAAQPAVPTSPPGSPPAAPTPPAQSLPVFNGVTAPQLLAEQGGDPDAAMAALDAYKSRMPPRTYAAWKGWLAATKALRKK